MENSIKYIKKSRSLFVQLLDELSLDQLNETPEGFGNNIIWNFAHSIVSTLGLVYVRSGIDVSFEVPYAALFGKGTRPQGFISQQVVDELRELAVSSLQQITVDFEKGRFRAITPYSTDTYGYIMDSMEEVLSCCLAHESMHLGIGKAQKVIMGVKYKEYSK